LANKLNERFGYASIVDNRPGAGSQVAVSALKQTAPDGATLFLGDIGAFSLNRFLYPKLSYDVDRDLTPIALLAKAPLFLVVPSSSSVQSVAELLALGWQRPRGLSYASPGVGTGAHIAAEMLGHTTGVRLVHVPYRGAGPALIDVAGGQVDFILDPLVSSGPFLKDGRTRALAIAAPSRSTFLPKVPTLREAGVDGVTFTAWWGLAALAATAPAEVKRLNTDIAHAMASNDVAHTLGELGLELGTLSAEDFRLLIDADAGAYAAIIKDLAIKLD
jgi:tripartite-type tricarboxylate transporter receptor subunit TctC